MIRSPGFAMDCLPLLQQIIDVILDQSLDVTQLWGPESKITRQADG
jgi:hypothetical protein